jgi:hypothetical protein
MPAPTLTSSVTSTWTDTVATAETTGTLTWAAGDRVLVLGVTEDMNNTIAAPTATGLTFAALGSALNAASNCWAHAWQATAAGAGSATVSAAAGEVSTAMRGIWATAWGSCTGFVRTNSQGTATDTLSVTRTQANSAVAYIAADWNAVGATAPGWVPAGFTQVQALAHTNVSAFAAYWGDQGAVGATAYGPDGLTGTRKWTKVGVEVLGTVSTGASGPLRAWRRDPLGALLQM